MADDSERVCESLTTEKTYKKKTTVTRYRKSKRNTLRRIRRKRSKVRYYKSLRQLRYNRNTEDLCSAVQVFDIGDMEWAPSCRTPALPSEVTEWQKQDQIAYWKSRAISFELENRMLHEHLRNVYAKTIEDRLQYAKTYSECNKANAIAKGNNKQIEAKNKSVQDKVSNKKNQTEMKKPVSPIEPEGKNRLEEMKAIYGNKAQKIMGMETALELNYERIMDQSKPPHWPGIPLRLSFE